MYQIHNMSVNLITGLFDQLQIKSYIFLLYWNKWNLNHYHNSDNQHRKDLGTYVHR
jgi:hypothetical protein